MSEDGTHGRERPAEDDAPSAENGVAGYNRILQMVCDYRPSGTRGRLASALGTNRSFVSQLVSPAYAVPIPAQHIETIFEVCHFPSSEREAFLDAYDRAHPGRRSIARGTAMVRSLTLEVPDLGSPSKNEMFDEVIKEHLRNLSRILLGQI